MRCIGAFLFQQVAQIFVRHVAEHPPAATMNRGELEVDHRGAPVRRDQPVLRFGDVVMGDTGAAHLAQQASGVAIPGRVGRFGQMQGRAFGPAAQEAGFICADQDRAALDPAHGAKTADFLARQEPGDGAGIKRHRVELAQDDGDIGMAVEMPRDGFGKDIALVHGIRHETGRGDIGGQGHGRVLVGFSDRGKRGSSRPCGPALRDARRAVPIRGAASPAGRYRG